jgi:hypothetical protein
MCKKIKKFLRNVKINFTNKYALVKQIEKLTKELEELKSRCQ